MKKGKLFKILLDVKERKGAGFFCLIDPDRQSPEKAREIAQTFNDSDVDAILVGSSIMLKDNFDETIKYIKKVVDIPVIIFPGLSNCVSPYADGILFLSMMSSRNPQVLIGEQVRTSPLVKKYNLETIPTGYFLIESGTLTSVQYMSHSIPIPRNKPDIAISHALAAQYLGAKIIFFDCGSGAQKTIPNEMISKVKEIIDIPLIVGGGIKSEKIAKQKIEAGADFIVVGNMFENNNSKELIKNFAKSIHKE